MLTVLVQCKQMPSISCFAVHRYKAIAHAFYSTVISMHNSLGRFSIPGMRTNKSISEDQDCNWASTSDPREARWDWAPEPGWAWNQMEAAKGGSGCAPLHGQWSWPVPALYCCVTGPSAHSRPAPAEHSALERLAHGIKNITRLETVMMAKLMNGIMLGIAHPSN